VTITDLDGLSNFRIAVSPGLTFPVATAAAETTPSFPALCSSDAARLQAVEGFHEPPDARKFGDMRSTHIYSWAYDCRFPNQADATEVVTVKQTAVTMCRSVIRIDTALPCDKLVIRTMMFDRCKYLLILAAKQLYDLSW
jgi:hypothetical protein